MSDSSISKRELNARDSADKLRHTHRGQFPIAWNQLPRTRREGKSLKATNSGITLYFNAKKCPHGHLARRFISTGMCQECLQSRQLEINNTVKNKRSQEIIAKAETRICPHCKKTFPMTPEDRQDKIFCSQSCAQKSASKQWAERNPERRREISAKSALKIYKQKTVSERREARNKSNKNMGARRKAAHNMRTRINGAIRQALGGSGAKSWSLRKDLGFDVDAYMRHMESLWEPGMSWENLGKGPGKWVRDEIKPMCSFDMTDMEQARECLSLENLRPIWWEENASKIADDRKQSLKLQADK